MATTTAPTTDLVVLDDVNTNDDSDNEGTSNAALGAVCLAAGVAIGTFVVPPVVGFVRGLFTKSEPDIAAKVEEIVKPSETPKDKKAV
jgi:hypothetical protein